MKPKADYPPFPNTPRWLAHDLLQILRGADLFCPEPYPLWVKHSLERGPLVVVRRAEPLDGMIPVGVRGPKIWCLPSAQVGPPSDCSRTACCGARMAW
jgi:hypothetical protein